MQIFFLLASPFKQLMLATAVLLYKTVNKKSTISKKSNLQRRIVYMHVSFRFVSYNPIHLLCGTFKFASSLVYDLKRNLFIVDWPRFNTGFFFISSFLFILFELISSIEIDGFMAFVAKTKLFDFRCFRHWLPKTRTQKQTFAWK